MMRMFKDAAHDLILFKCRLFNQPNRPTIQAVRRLLSPPLVGIEVGVYRGNHALNILKTTEGIKRLFLVDPYFYDTPVDLYSTIIQYPKTDLDEAKKIAQKRLAPYGDIVHFLYSPFSRELSFPCKVDFIYIDGDHSYPSVSSDIKTSLEFIRDGGIIGGHDYGLPSVQEAVDEFFPDAHKWRNDWWTQKGIQECLERKQ